MSGGFPPVLEPDMPCLVRIRDAPAKIAGLRNFHGGPRVKVTLCEALVSAPPIHDMPTRKRRPADIEGPMLGDYLRLRQVSIGARCIVMRLIDRIDTRNTLFLNTELDVETVLLFFRGPECGAIFRSVMNKFFHRTVVVLCFTSDNRTPNDVPNVSGNAGAASTDGACPGIIAICRRL